MRRSADNGFTLIELMVVLVILGLASATVVLAIPDPRGRIVDEAERFAGRAIAVRDNAIISGRAASLRVDDTGYSVETRRQGRWVAATDRALAPVGWSPGTRPAAALRVTFDATGAASEPVAVVVTRDTGSAQVDIGADGAVRVAR